MAKRLKLLFAAPFIGALGSGAAGGVELTLRNIAQALRNRGHDIAIAAPQGSVVESFQVIEVAGNPQISAQTCDRSDPIILPKGSGLAQLWETIRAIHTEYDLILNFAYDWLPLYLTPFLQRPVAHLISMGSLTDAMDEAIAAVIEQFPGTIGMHTTAQAQTFPFSKACVILGNGFDLSQYEFCPTPTPQLAWVARIAPEKGLEDAVAAAQQTGIPLKIMGAMENPEYWQKILQTYPHAPIEYAGFLSTQALQSQLRRCRALLMTPRWVEAFGNVAIEALACGVPVIGYRRGGIAEIVADGKTGFLVEPDSVSGLVEAIAKLDQINRQDCYKAAQTEYSLEALGDRYEQWFSSIQVLSVKC